RTLSLRCAQVAGAPHVLSGTSPQQKASSPLKTHARVPCSNGRVMHLPPSIHIPPMHQYKRSPLTARVAAILGLACLLCQSSASALTIPVEDDASVVAGTYATNNYGHSPNVSVHGTTPNHRGYLNFGDINAYLPSGTTANDVRRAFIHLYINTISG